MKNAIEQLLHEAEQRLQMINQEGAECQQEVQRIHARLQALQGQRLQVEGELKAYQAMLKVAKHYNPDEESPASD